MKLFRKKNNAPVLHIDFPKRTPRASVFKVQGWIATNEPIDFISLEEVHLEFYERPDVKTAYPGFTYIKGFHGIVTCNNVDHNSLVFQYSINNELNNFIHALVPSPMYILSKKEKFQKFCSVFPDEKPERLVEKSSLLALNKEKTLWRKQKREKLKKITSRLVCPECKVPIKIERNLQGDFRCNNCKEIYHFNDIQLNLLAEKTRRSLNIEKTDNVATRAHDPLALSIIGKYPDGLILDCGAGYPFVEYLNVINYEIADYTSTDIVGVGEKLPFADNTFDAAFSLSVLEHVKDPFLCASELSRVLKPNGLLYCSVPFLQPLHAYPHHYYNMTSHGLKSLFESKINILQSGVPISGMPIFTLNWILKSWMDGLEENIKKEFLEMTVQDLLKDPEQYVQQPFVNTLSTEKNLELASTSMILGRKHDN